MLSAILVMFRTTIKKWKDLRYLRTHEKGDLAKQKIET